jgi:hypothetical protein
VIFGTDGDHMKARQRSPSSDRKQALLDEGLTETFPASDPVAIVAPGGGITGPEKLAGSMERRATVAKRRRAAERDA